MVFAVRCPNPQCRKFMLVEEHDRGKVVTCLICKQPIKVPDPPPTIVLWGVHDPAYVRLRNVSYISNDACVGRSGLRRSSLTKACA